MKRDKELSKTILVNLSDLHGGHRHGLLKRGTVLHEYDENGGVVGDYEASLTPVQEYLDAFYDECIGKVRELSKGSRIVLSVNGDLITGDKHDDELVSDRMSDQVIIGASNLAPWYGLKNLAAVRIMKGTQAHNFGFGSGEILIAELLKAKFPNVSTQIVDHALLTIDGVEFDIAHHGPPPGSRNWLVGNEARYYMRSLMMDELSAGRTPPRIILRGHYHRYVQETLTLEHGLSLHTSTLVINPSFSFPNAHARQATRSPFRIKHGLTVFELVDGEVLRITPVVKTIDIRTKEIL